MAMRDSFFHVSWSRTGSWSLQSRHSSPNAEMMSQYRASTFLGPRQSQTVLSHQIFDVDVLSLEGPLET